MVCVDPGLHVQVLAAAGWPGNCILFRSASETVCSETPRTCRSMLMPSAASSMYFRCYMSHNASSAPLQAAARRLPRQNMTSFAAVVEAAEDREAAYGQLLDELSRLCPSLLPASAVWGFGRPLWDPACRTLGMRPLR